MLNVSVMEINKGSKLLLYCLVPVYTNSTPWIVEVELHSFLMSVPDGIGQYHFFLWVCDIFIRIHWWFSREKMLVGFILCRESSVYMYVCEILKYRVIRWHSVKTVWALNQSMFAGYYQAYSQLLVRKPSTVHSTEGELLSQTPHTVFYMLPVSLVVKMSILCQQYLFTWHHEYVK